jgi:hypothetical protein
VRHGRGLDRRAFLRRAGQTGLAAGAIAWSPPRLRTASAAQAGSPPPVTPPTIKGGDVTPGGSIDLSGTSGGTAPGGDLAQTGAELGQMAAIGGAAVAAGQMLRKKGLRLDELTGEPDAGAEAPPIDPPDPPVDV